MHFQNILHILHELCLWLFLHLKIPRLWEEDVCLLHPAGRPPSHKHVRYLIFFLFFCCQFQISLDSYHVSIPNQLLWLYCFDCNFISVCYCSISLFCPVFVGHSFFSRKYLIASNPATFFHQYRKLLVLVLQILDLQQK